MNITVNKRLMSPSAVPFLKMAVHRIFLIFDNYKLNNWNECDRYNFIKSMCWNFNVFFYYNIQSITYKMSLLMLIFPREIFGTIVNYLFFKFPIFRHWLKFIPEKYYTFITNFKFKLLHKSNQIVNFIFLCFSFLLLFFCSWLCKMLLSYIDGFRKWRITQGEGYLKERK